MNQNYAYKLSDMKIKLNIETVNLETPENLEEKLKADSDSFIGIEVGEMPKVTQSQYTP